MGYFDSSISNRATNSLGAPVEGARRYVYHDGTDTLARLFTDPQLTDLQANPMVSRADGSFGGCYLLDGRYRVRIEDARGNTLSEEGEVRFQTPGQAIKELDSYAEFFADTSLSYTPGEGKIEAKAGDIVQVHEFSQAYEVVAEDYTLPHVVTQGGVRLLPISDKQGFNVRAFGALGDGVTDDTVPIQTAINAAAWNCDGVVHFPAGHYVVETLVDHFDEVINPGYPAGSHRQGRITLLGARPVDLIQRQFQFADCPGALIRTTLETGPALRLGNGEAAGTLTARRTEVEAIAFEGTCTGAVIEVNGATQHSRFENLTILNHEGANGIGLHLYGGFYASTLRNIHIASTGMGGTGLLCETASLCIFDLVNITDCGGTAWVLGTDAADANSVGYGTGNTFVNCQGRKSANGLEIKGGRSNTFQGWWLEKNTGEFDLKIHHNATNTNFESMFLTSTELSAGSALFGGNSGVAYQDACRGIFATGMTFNFCGPTSAQAGVVKQGTCTDLTLDGCSFKNNGGRGIIIDTTHGVTSTTLTEADFFPVGATSEIASTSRVVDQNGTPVASLIKGLDTHATFTPVAPVAVAGASDNGAGLVRISAVGHGLVDGDYVHITGVNGTTEANGNWDITVIDADTFDLVGSSFANAYSGSGACQKFALDMRSWNFLPEFFTVTTTSNGLVALPEDCSAMSGQMLSIRKNLSGNALRVVGTINANSEVIAFADEEVVTVRALTGARYAQL